MCTLKRINSNFSADPTHKVITHCGCSHGKSAKALGLGTHTTLNRVKELPQSALPVTAQNKCGACGSTGVALIDYGTYKALAKDHTNRNERVVFNAYFVQGRTPPTPSHRSHSKRKRFNR